MRASLCDAARAFPAHVLRSLTTASTAPVVDPKTTVYDEGVLYDVYLSLGESLTRRSDESVSTEKSGMVYIKRASDASTRARAHRERRVPMGRSIGARIAALPGGAMFAPPGGARWRHGDGSVRKRCAIFFSVTIRARAGATKRGRRRKRRRLVKGEWRAGVVIGTRAMTGGD